jgi:hypothetical protein
MCEVGSVRSTLRLIILVLIGGPVFAPAVWTLAASDQPTTVQPTQADESEQHLYAPPKKLIPRARVGGEMRGTDGSDPEVQPLAPDHVGFTVEKAPTINWFLSKPTTHRVTFTLTDSRVIRPVFEGPIPTPKEPGIHAIRLKDLGLTLETDVQYRWYVSVERDHDSRSRDIVAGGVIERCELTECLQDRPTRLSCSMQSVKDNAKNGLWYDAMACLCGLIDLTPTDIQLRKLRITLLRDIGLSGVAEWDQRAIQSLTR